MKDNGFKLTKERSMRYPAQTIMGAGYVDDIALRANNPLSRNPATYFGTRAAGIGLHGNAHKTECICFYQTGDISTLDSSSLKLVDMFTYLGISVSSTETDMDTRLAKASITIDKLSVISKSVLIDRIKRNFFPSSGRVDTVIWMHDMDAN